MRCNGGEHGRIDPQKTAHAPATTDPKTANVLTRYHIQQLEKENLLTSSGYAGALPVKNPNT